MQIYIHGLGQTAKNWERTISELKFNGPFFCLDLAGLIQNEEVNYRNLYQAFVQRLDEIDEPLDLCGLSLGGVMALNFAIEYPQKVNSLVLIAPQYKMPKQLLKFQNVMFRLMPKSMFGQTGFRKNEFLQLCSSMMELDFSKSVHEINCPVLVVCGEKDTANRKASENLASALKNAKFQLIEGFGHELNIDAPEKLAEVMRNFFDKLESLR